MPEAGLYHINELIEKLQHLNEIVTHNGHWVNIKELLDITYEAPQLLEHAQEAREYMKEMIAEEVEIEQQYQSINEKMREIGMSEKDFV